MGLGLGFGYVAKGIADGQSDAQKHERESLALDLARKADVRQDLLFQQQQQDRAFKLPYEQGSIKTQAEAQQLELAGKRRTEREAKFSDLYNTYMARGADAAVAELKGMGVADAARIAEEKDPITGRTLIKIFDANGNLAGGGSLVVDKEYARLKYGPKGEKGRYNIKATDDGRIITLDTATGKHSVSGAGGMPGYVNPKSLEADTKLKNAVYPLWGKQMADGLFSFDANAPYAARHFSLASELLRKGHNMADAVTRSYRIVDAEKAAAEARDRYRGEIPGSAGILSSFDPRAAAKDVARLFPSGSTEQQVRDFMGKRGISNPEQQDQVLGLLRQPSTPLTSQPHASYTAPNGRPVSRQEIEATANNRGITPDQVIQALRLRPVAPAAPATAGLPAGVTKAEALSQAKSALTKADPERAAQIRQRLKSWGVTDQEMAAAGLM